MAELSVLDAENLLKPFVCNDESGDRSDAEWKQVRDAILTLVKRSDFQTLGICANSSEQAMSALKSYLQAFGDRVDDLGTVSESNESESVYIKFNTQRRSIHRDRYSGDYRGVLVTCQSQDPSQSGGTYGHFPLNLFAAESGSFV